MDVEETKQLIERLVQGYDRLQLALEKEEIVFQNFKWDYDTGKCPPQAELAPILKSFEKIALVFSDWLEILYRVVNNKNALVALRKMRPEARGIGLVDPGQLLSFYGAAAQAEGPADVRSYFGEQVSQLGIAYAYYGSSMTASSSLISKMSFLTKVFTKPGDDVEWDEYIEFAPRLLKKEYIQGLRLLSKRAAFLAVATEKEIRSSEVSWWCDQVDMTPKDEAALYRLGYMIDHCPQPTHPDVIERLQELAVHQGVQESIREQAQAVLDQG
jgi:hypothetical protein